MSLNYFVASSFVSANSFGAHVSVSSSGPRKNTKGNVVMVIAVTVIAVAVHTGTVRPLHCTAGFCAAMTMRKLNVARTVRPVTVTVRAVTVRAVTVTAE